ncbi:DUF5818 domain-containing protein [Sphingobium sp. AP50]|uniref:DUF5818 domain-containing protein n=1 Tax=Sphingobium sp. AP50 TaxID=1884369 RepID=UPI000B875532|nr:DUF5818 domain-containing protein [Sphingobium sp. AP50]
MSGGKAPLRLRGVMRLGERGPWLEEADGTVWRIEAGEDLADYADRPVQIEGWQRGASHLELLWIGSVAG